MTTSQPSESPDVAAQNWSAFVRAYGAGHEDYLRLAAKCNNFYLGEQWDPAEKAQVESEGRPALTINEILEVVKSIRGHYSTTRADIQYKPYRRGATSEVAHTLTRLLDQILDANDYHDRLEPQVFEDGLIEDRGYFDIRINFDENVLGEVKITVLDPRTVIPDPEAKDYDPATWSQWFLDTWMSLDDIELYYGADKRKSVEALCASPQETFGSRSVLYDSFAGDQSPGMPVDIDDTRRVKSVRVIERQYRKLGFVQELVDLETGETRPVPAGWDEERVQAVCAEYGLVTRRVLRSRVRWTVTADRVVLHDDWSPYDDFTLVPFFPIFRRGRPSGVVRHLLDPQTQFNKSESQILHIVNTTANSGWMVEEGSLRNMSEEELEENGSKTGLVLVYGRNRQKPEKIQPNQIPTGLEQISRKAQSHIHNISGASGLLGRTPSSEVSGVALDRTAAKSLTSLQVVFDNLEYTRKLVAKRILRLVQQFYTEARVYYVTDWRDPEMTQEEVAINQQVAGMIVNDISLGEYEVKATTAPARDTFEETQFAEALQLREAGVLIPDHHVILASHLAGKRQIAEEAKQLQGLGEPSPQQQMLAEIEVQSALFALQKMQSEVGLLQAQIELIRAKAQGEVGNMQVEEFKALSQHERELTRMQIDITKAMQNLQNKLDLAQLHSGAKTALTRYSKQIERNERARDREFDLAKTQLHAHTQLTNTLMAAAGRSSASPRPLRAES